jgi:hypothetical protein
MDKLYEHASTILVGGIIFYFAEPTLKYYGNKALNTMTDTYFTLKTEGVRPYLRRHTAHLACVAVDKYIDLKWQLTGKSASVELERLDDTPEPVCIVEESTIHSSLKHVMYSNNGVLYLYFGDTLPHTLHQDDDSIENIIIHTNNGENLINHNETLAKYIKMCIGPNGSSPLPSINQLRSILELTDMLYNVDKIIVNMSESLRELIIN